MNRKITYLDFGLGEYKQVWEKQEELMSEIINIKLRNKEFSEATDAKTPNYLIFVEHPHVYTLGKSGDEHNLLLNYIQLQAAEATFFKTDRGGDITYHGPGQLVGYPILDLENYNIGLRTYIYNVKKRSYWHWLNLESRLRVTHMQPAFGLIQVNQLPEKSALSGLRAPGLLPCTVLR